MNIIEMALAQAKGVTKESRERLNKIATLTSTLKEKKRQVVELKNRINQEIGLLPVTGKNADERKASQAKLVSESDLIQGLQKDQFSLEKEINEIEGEIKMIEAHRQVDLEEIRLTSNVLLTSMKVSFDLGGGVSPAHESQPIKEEVIPQSEPSTIEAEPEAPKTIDLF